MSRPELVLVNMQSELAAPFLQALAEALTGPGLHVRFDDSGHWTARRERLLRGEAHLGFWCGLPYALEADLPEPRVALLAAPVMAEARYDDRPIYFSDVVVARDSAFERLEDLAGATWAYNEPCSHSGYALTRYTLERLGFPHDFFGHVVEAGSHFAALQGVIAGTFDAAAIDSTVLAQALHAEPGLAAFFRVLTTWGPSTMPPLLVSRTVPEATRQVLKNRLLALSGHATGRRALALGLFSRFADVTDADYDAIRAMAKQGARYPLAPR